MHVATMYAPSARSQRTALADDDYGGANNRAVKRYDILVDARLSRTALTTARLFLASFSLCASFVVSLHSIFSLLVSFNTISTLLIFDDLSRCMLGKTLAERFKQFEHNKHFRNSCRMLYHNALNLVSKRTFLKDTTIVMIALVAIFHACAQHIAPMG